MKRYLNALCASLLISQLSLAAYGQTLHTGADRGMLHERLYIRAGLGLPTYRKIGGENEGIKANFKPIGNMALGWNWNKHFSSEVEGGYIDLPIKFTAQGKAQITKFNSRIKSYTLLLNFIARTSYEWGNNNKLLPFIGAGVGYVSNSLSDLKRETGAVLGVHTKNNKVAYQVFVGAELPLNPNFSVLLDARWVDLNKSGWRMSWRRYSRKFRLGMQTITVGAKFNF